MQVVDIIRAHPDHEVIIGVDTLGKEDLLLHISRALQTKVIDLFSQYSPFSTLHRTLMNDDELMTSFFGETTKVAMASALWFSVNLLFRLVYAVYNSVELQTIDTLTADLTDFLDTARQTS